MMTRTRVLIADDHELFRQTVRSLVEMEPEFEISGEAEDGTKALESAMSQDFDLVLMDVAMPILDGIAATRKILSARPHLKVIALSSHGNPVLVKAMIQAGARGYLLKTRAGHELGSALKTVRDGRPFIGSGLHEGAFAKAEARGPADGAIKAGDQRMIRRPDLEGSELIREG